MGNCLNYRLIQCNYDNTPTFSFNKLVLKAKVIRVYDGDTLWVAIRYNHKYVKMKVRLLGIDTPEIRTNNLEEKKKAILARDFLRNLILNKIVKLHCDKFDKYGRLLGKIYIKNNCVNDTMIDKGYGVSYDGGSKNK